MASEDTVQRLMGLHDRAADAYVENCLADERGDAEAYERSRMDMHQARSTLESALREALMPAGWKLAPVEPTDEMEVAAEKQPEQPLGVPAQAPSGSPLRCDPSRYVRPA